MKGQRCLDPAGISEDPKNKKKESMCSRNKETKTQDKKACKMYVNKTLD